MGKDGRCMSGTEAIASERGAGGTLAARKSRSGQGEAPGESFRRLATGNELKTIDSHLRSFHRCPHRKLSPESISLPIQ